MAKQGLRKTWNLKAKLVSNLGKSSKKQMGEGDEKRKRKKKRRRKRRDQVQKGMETMDFVWITWNLRLDMVNILSLNLGFDRIAFSPWIS